MIGINDIARRDYYTGRSTPAYSTPNKLRNDMMEKYIALCTYCCTECNVEEVVICTMVGIGLSTRKSQKNREE